MSQHEQIDFSSEVDRRFRRPVISSKNFEDVKFEIPPRQNFPVFGSILSILSLILLSGLGLYIYLQIKEQPLWVTLPFLFTIFGGSVGWLLEIGLFVNGTPFQMTLNRLTVFITKIRLLNIAPVVSTLFFFVCSIAIPDPNLRLAFFYLAVFGCFAMAVGLFFGGVTLMPLIILAIQAVQFFILIIYGAQAGGDIVKWLLIGQTVTQTTAFIVGTSTPIKSFGFHVLSTISGLLAYGAIATVIKADPGFTSQVSPLIPLWSLRMWVLVAAILMGVIFTLRASSMTYNIWRSGFSNLIWSLQYFLLISAKRFPKPYNLSELYKNGPPKPAKLQPYYQQHSTNLPENLAIPAVEKLEKNVTAFMKLITKAKKAFALISIMDHVFPQADVKIPLGEKPRMKIWSSGSDIYPRIYLKKLFGYSIAQPDLPETPEPAIEAFKKGQLLAYLGEFGVANPFLKTAPGRDDGTLVMDFRFLEKYETKADYESYGGMAFFRVNSEDERLELLSVVAPHTSEEIKVDPMDSNFRHAESLVLASMYFYVISGKHLAEIHMTYNLVEAVLHNAFDAHGQFNHPLRTFIYIHLFSHELAEEMTTEHLVQEGAVFNQIFATTQDDLIDYINDIYYNFEYGEDEEFQRRRDVLKMANGKVLPKACINWETQYADIWKKYTDDLLDIIYKDDGELRKDQYVQDLYRGLLEVIPQGLPERYDKFQSKAGVSLWAADTIHHMVVRHQVYGTSGIRAAMDPRISSTQIPKDGGTPGVDEWRSLIGVAMATGYARFTLLVGKDGEDFTYLLNGVDDKYKNRMAEVFEQLQENLLALDAEWTEDHDEIEYNYDYFRPLPSKIRTGAGY